MVALVAASLFTTTLSQLHRNEGALRTRQVVWTRLARSPGDRVTLDRRYFQELHRRLAAIRGVDAATFSSSFPALIGLPGPIPTEKVAPAAGDFPGAVSAAADVVSPGFFDFFGISRLRGRDFTWDDDTRAPAVAIVSEALARKLFQTADAVGQRLRVSTGPSRLELVIVGVVSDMPAAGIRDPHAAAVFRPLLQDLTRAQLPLAHVRASGDLQRVRDDFIRVVTSEGHHYVRGLLTLGDWLDLGLLEERLIAGLSTSAGMFALLAASIGLYGLLSYTVTSSTREIGLRMALGATRADVVGSVAREAAWIVMGGLAVGIPSALGLSQLVQSRLYGLSPTAPAPIVFASAALMTTAAVAAVVPAMRASKVDPMDALRHE